MGQGQAQKIKSRPTAMKDQQTPTEHQKMSILQFLSTLDFIISTWCISLFSLCQIAKKSVSLPCIHKDVINPLPSQVLVNINVMLRWRGGSCSRSHKLETNSLNMKINKPNVITCSHSWHHRLGKAEAILLFWRLSSKLKNTSYIMTIRAFEQLPHLQYW